MDFWRDNWIWRFGDFCFHEKCSPQLMFLQRNLCMCILMSVLETWEDGLHGFEICSDLPISDSCWSLGKFLALMSFCVPFLQWVQAKVNQFNSQTPNCGQFLGPSLQRNPKDNGSFGVKTFPQLLWMQTCFIHSQSGQRCNHWHHLFPVFQAITISPRNSKWAELKAKVLKYIGSSNTLCWILHMLVNFIFLMFGTGKLSNKTITVMFCPTPLHEKVSDAVYTALIAFHDVLCLGLVSWASGSMVFILYGLSQRVQHIHRTKVSPRSSPETRAIHTILILVTAFVSFYTLSFMFYVYLALCDNPSWWVVTTSILITAGFLTVRLFVLMNRNPNVHRLCSFCCERDRIPWSHQKNIKWFVWGCV